MVYHRKLLVSSTLALILGFWSVDAFAPSRYAVGGAVQGGTTASGRLTPLFMAGGDYYSTLEVPRDADISTIKKAYRKMAKKYHPGK